MVHENLIILKVGRHPPVLERREHVCLLWPILTFSTSKPYLSCFFHTCTCPVPCPCRSFTCQMPQVHPGKGTLVFQVGHREVLAPERPPAGDASQRTQQRHDLRGRGSMQRDACKGMSVGGITVSLSVSRLRIQLSIRC